MSITPVPISIRFVLAPTAARSGNGEESWRAKWCTRKYAPSAPSSSAATARSMDCRSASAAERVCECGEGVQCPNERKPIFFMRLHPADILVVKADSIFAQRRTTIGLKPFLHRSPHLESQPCVLVSRSRLDAQSCNFSEARPSPHVCDDRLD